MVGRSLLVGKPVALLGLQRKASATVTVCHSGTADLPAITRQADVLVVAIGRPDFITADMVKPGAVVIDVGINRVCRFHPQIRPPARRRRCNLQPMSPLASKITPVLRRRAGRPMTVAMLMHNTLKARLQNDK